jgi:allantoate deiminase
MRDILLSRAEEVIHHCRALAGFTETPGATTRTFLSAPMREVHSYLSDHMKKLGMKVSIDAIGNLHGMYNGMSENAPRLILGSHLDTVPNAGAFDGILGVIVGMELIKLLNGKRFSYAIEVVGFSEEEGVRFDIPFIGSRALVGTIDNALLAKTDRDGISVSDAIRNFGLDPRRIMDAKIENDILGFLEFHIEQGPVLEKMNTPVAIVDAVAGQTRMEFIFEGISNHAGTTPMNLRRDALAGASEWILIVEKIAATVPDLVATVGKIDVEPNAENVIARSANASLDVRHKDNAVRKKITEDITHCADEVSKRRGLDLKTEFRLDQSSVAMDRIMTDILSHSVEAAGLPVHKMTSGAGHDAMIIAQKAPTAMLFVRSPKGISHHPDETVLLDDVAAALHVGIKFLENLNSAKLQ